MSLINRYVPIPDIQAFKDFAKVRYDVDADTLEEDVLAKYVNEFILSRKTKPKVEVAKVVIPKIEKTEKEIFNEVVEKRFPSVEWDKVTEIIWMPAVTKDTADSVYSIEVVAGKVAYKKIVMRDKSKSLAFLSHLNLKFTKALNETD